jgi:hypothetical protein
MNLFRAKTEEPVITRREMEVRLDILFRMARLSIVLAGQREPSFAQRIPSSMKDPMGQQSYMDVADNLTQEWKLTNVRFSPRDPRLPPRRPLPEVRIRPMASTPPVEIKTIVSAPPTIDNTAVPVDDTNTTIIFKVMSPLAQVLVRAARTYVQGLVGFLLMELAAKPVAEGLGVVVPVGDFLALFVTAAGLAVAPTVVSLLQNAGEFLTSIDSLFPKARA